MSDEELPKCWVCGKPKKPYAVIMNSSIFNFIDYHTAREKGEICERCDRFYAMTHEFKDATDEEFKIAEEAVVFARKMEEWWTKDKPFNIDGISDSIRDWEGTENIKKWYREKYGDKK